MLSDVFVKISGEFYVATEIKIMNCLGCCRSYLSNGWSSNGIVFATATLLSCWNCMFFAPVFLKWSFSAIEKSLLILSNAIETVTKPISNVFFPVFVAVCYLVYGCDGKRDRGIWQRVCYKIAIKLVNFHIRYGWQNSQFFFILFRFVW